LKLSDSENEVNKWSLHCQELKAEKENLDKRYGLLRQQYENDHNLKAKNEIDLNYLKSLRYTVNHAFIVFCQSQESTYL
jgi:hypothetical protein